MAKVKINWPPMSMKAEGEDAAVLAQAEQFLKYVKEAHKISFDVLPTIFRDGCRDPEEGVGEPECVGCNDDCESCETYEKANSVKPLTEPEEVAPGAQWDVVAIYDNAGIPSIMHRFIRKEDYGTAPKVGKLMEYDGICYTIRSCQTEHGLYLVELERVRQ